MTAAPVIIVGAGQAGLSAGYWLARRDVPFLIVDAEAEIGASWTRRWDGLRLFSPHGVNDLPGMRFPRSAPRFPGKDDVAAYLRAYQARFDLPVRLRTPIRALTHGDGHYQLTTDGETLHAEHVIVATGPFQRPVRPAFADDLDGSVWQSHSSGYQNPEQLPSGPALVVGAGNSGAQIAMELAGVHETWLAGESPGYVPRTLLGLDIYTWLRHTGLLTATDAGWTSGATSKTASGDPRLGITPRDLDALGVRCVPSVAGMDGSAIVLAGGRRLSVAGVVWATGFRTDFGWIDRPIFDADGSPRHRLGVVDGEPGLYFLGLKRLSRLNSSLLNGVGADAAHLAAVIAARLVGLPDPAPDRPSRFAAIGTRWRRAWVGVLLGRTPPDPTGPWTGP